MMPLIIEIDLFESIAENFKARGAPQDAIDFIIKLMKPN